MQKLIVQVNVRLTTEEADALLAMASVDCRHPREQMRWLVQQEARKRNLLCDEGAIATDKGDPSHEEATR